MESFDELTGMLNREAFYQAVQRMLAAHEDTPFAMMCANVERFKFVNELFGEDAGDRLLKSIGVCLQGLSLRLTLIARLYSDHFVIFFPAGMGYRERLLDTLRQAGETFADNYMVNIDCGVYHIMERHLPVSIMCDRAKLAMQKAKNNYFVSCGEYDDELRDSLLKEQRIINAMEGALREKQFRVFLQPKYDLVTEKVVGAEALVRWKHPKLGLISPGEFIPVFERNGFIMKLDEYVWEETCRIIKRWQDEGRTILPVSVNISRMDLFNPRICDILSGLVAKYGLAPEILQLEITESAYIENSNLIISVTQCLQKMGFTILMDDFGSGYSSLNMLKDVPVDILKLDLRFLDSKDTSGRGGNILNSIVRMAKWMNIGVIAEGVETKAQADFLRNIGCHMVQGYYYSKPVPVDVYEARVEQTGAVEDLTSSKLSLEDTEDMWNPLTQYELLFNNHSCSIALIELSADSGLELLRGNDGYYSLFGELSEENMVQRQVFPDIFAEDEAKLLKKLGECSTHDKETEILVRCRHSNSLLWLDVHVVMILQDCRRRLFYVFIHNVSRLQEQAGLLHSLLDNSPVGLAIYDMQDTNIFVKYMSPNVYEFNGMEKKSSEKDWRQFEANTASVETAFRRLANQSCKENKPVSCQYLFTESGGDKCWVNINIRAVRNDNGGITCYVILERLNDMPILRQHICIYDFREDRLFLSIMAQRMLKEPSREIEDAYAYIKEAAFIDEKDKTSFRQTIERIKDGTLEEMDWMGMVLAAGKPVWIHLSGYIMKSDDGQPLFCVFSRV